MGGAEPAGDGGLTGWEGWRSASLAQQALAFAKTAFGLRDPRTLTSMSNLAVTLESQGRYGEAEPLVRKTLQLSWEALGPRDPDTLDSMEEPGRGS